MSFIPYPVNGYTLQFTGRKTWTAKRTYRGREIDIVPCTWTRDIKTDEEGRRTVIVYYPTEKKRISKAANPKPFVVAIMEAKNWQTRPLSFKRFVTLYEVRANGRVLGPHSIEADILRSVS